MKKLSSPILILILTKKRRLKLDVQI